AGKQESVGWQSGDCQTRYDRARAGHGSNFMAGFPRGAHQLVAGIGNQGRSRVAHKRDRLIAEAIDDRLPLGLGCVVVVAPHRRLRTDVREQFARYACVFRKDSVRLAQRIGGARAEIPQIPDRGRDYVEAGRKRISHQRTPISTSNPTQKESSSCPTLRQCLGRGTMIPLIAASAMFLAASQAAVAAPTNAYKNCLKQASTQAKKDKVSGDAYEAY